jgi:cytoskeletal protein CcmA (bactofilin family)
MNEIVTIVGEHTVIKGNLKGDEDLQVRGKVEGSIQLTKTLIVERSGIVVANISVQDAIVSGIVVGNITAANSVQITDEGRMVGDITAPRVIIVDGASYRGNVDMGDLEGGAPGALPPAPRAARKPVSPVSLPRPIAPPVRRQPEAASAKGEKPVAAREGKPSLPARPAPPRPPVAPRPPVTSEPTHPEGPKAGGAPARKPPRPPALPIGKRKIRRR